jgi:hypothetical protein
VGRTEGDGPGRAAGLGAGALLAVAVSLAHSAIQGGGRSLLPPPGAPAWWVADRDADRVYALDRDSIVALRVQVPRPIAVRSTADGGAWIVRSTTATARGERILVRVRPDGSIAVEIPVGGHPALAVTDGGEALLVEDGAGPEDPRRLVLRSQDGSARVLLEERGLVCASGSGTTVLAGSSTGEIRRLDAENVTSTCERIRLEPPIVALASADSGASYVLHGGEGLRLARLEPDLSIAWSVPCFSRRSCLAATPDGEHAWIVDLEAERVRKFDRAGKLVLERAVPGTGGIDGASATETGGLVLATPGALLVFDGKANPRAGQGGFTFVADLDRIPGR